MNIADAAWFLPLTSHTAAVNFSGDDKEVAFASSLGVLPVRAPEGFQGEGEDEEVLFFHALQEECDALIEDGYTAAQILTALNSLPKAPQGDTGTRVYCALLRGIQQGLTAGRAVEVCRMQARLIEREIMAEREHPAMYGVEVRA